MAGLPPSAMGQAVGRELRANRKQRVKRLESSSVSSAASPGVYLVGRIASTPAYPARGPFAARPFLTSESDAQTHAAAPGHLVGPRPWPAPLAN